MCMYPCPAPGPASLLPTPSIDLRYAEHPLQATVEHSTAAKSCGEHDPRWELVEEATVDEPLTKGLSIWKSVTSYAYTGLVIPV